MIKLDEGMQLYQQIIKDEVLNAREQKLSDEQEYFINESIKGKNLLVDACIGSGKTTSIQTLCDAFIPQNKILYLTFNKLLKLEAQEKIQNPNVKVTNYHGFVYPYLLKYNIKSSLSSSIYSFNNADIKIDHFDILIIDEYQDITEEYAKLLEKIKNQNPGIQIIAVGDMQQKIYDNTKLDVTKWMNSFLGEHKEINFTKCFRLNSKYANQLGKAWNKEINGVNSNQIVKRMKFEEAVEYAQSKNLKDIIVLGKKKGQGVELLNKLQELNPNKYNKNTMYISIADKDNKISPNGDVGIFTTFDASKGMERDICFVFDYHAKSYEWRRDHTDTSNEILKNIFLVGASRGKKEIIFVSKFIPQVDYYMSNFIGNIDFDKYANEVEEDKKINRKFTPSTMFDFKYSKDVRDSFNLLNIEKIQMDNYNEIKGKTTDGNLDISIAVGNYASAAFYKNVKVKDQLKYMNELRLIDDTYLKVYTAALKWQLLKEHDGYYNDLVKNPNDYKLLTQNGEYSTNFKHLEADIQWELLVALAAETGVKSYMTQISERYISNKMKRDLISRMETLLNREEDQTEKKYYLNDAAGNIEFMGMIDVLHDDEIYELKFVEELSMENYLQAAMYAIMSNKPYVKLWNLKTNELYKIYVKNKEEFMNQVVKTVTKGELNTFHF